MIYPGKMVFRESRHGIATSLRDRHIPKGAQEMLFDCLALCSVHKSLKNWIPVDIFLPAFL